MYFVEKLKEKEEEEKYECILVGNLDVFESNPNLHGKYFLDLQYIFDNNFAEVK